MTTRGSSGRDSGGVARQRVHVASLPGGEGGAPHQGCGRQQLASPGFAQRPHPLALPPAEPATATAPAPTQATTQVTAAPHQPGRWARGAGRGTLPRDLPSGGAGPPDTRPPHGNGNGTAAPRNAQTKPATLRPAWGRRGSGPGRGDLSTPPRHTDPPAADRAAPGARGCLATPTARVYPMGARLRQRVTGTGIMGHPTGQGGGAQRHGPPSPPSPPRSPPGLRATAAPALRPPLRAEGTFPLPEGTPRGGRSWIRTPRAPALPSACSRTGRGRRASPHQRARMTHRPRPGAACDDEPEHRVC